MADPPPHTPYSMCGPNIIANNSNFRLLLWYYLSLMNGRKEWSSLGIKGCPAFWIWAGARRKKRAWSAKGSREECALKTNRLFAVFWREQWLNGRFGGAAGVSAQPFSDRSVFVARLKEFVRLKGSWTGPGASMSYTLGVHRWSQGAECNRPKQSIDKARPWF